LFTGITTILPFFSRGTGDGPALDTLLRAAASALSQTCELPHELLIVDDGSQPELASREALRGLLSKPEVRLLRLAENQGLVYALNAGLTQARYDLIARIDGDDVWRPGKLARQLEAFRSDPDLTLVASSMRLVHPHNSSLDRDEIRAGGWREALALCRDIGCPFPHGSILARKDVFETLGGYPHSPQFTHCEDFALWTAWIRFFKVRIIEPVFLEYTVSRNQISARWTAQQRKAAARVKSSFLDLGDHDYIPEAIARIAQELALPLLQVSKALSTAWLFYRDIVADASLYEAAKIVFPDRAVLKKDEISQTIAGNAFYLGAERVSAATEREFLGLPRTVES
jgi:glycosyltransferase involved in cell wall biosynthesis